VLHNPSWDLDHDEFPSLPARPKFSIRQDGKSYTNIPVPREQRQRHGTRQIQKRWPQTGVIAWAHYIAAIDEAVAMVASPAEESQPEPELPGLEGVARFVQEPDSSVDDAFTAVLNSTVVGDIVASQTEVARLKTDIKVSVRFLAKQGCTRLSQLGKPGLLAFRRHCQHLVVNGEKSLRTANGYMAALRRVLKWTREFLEVDVPLHTDSALMNIRPKDLGASARTGLRIIGVGEIIAMPMQQLKSILLEARKDEFTFALVMCSLNLAAGSKDLTNLQFEDRSGANPRPIVDMKRRLFFTRRGKTGIKRYKMSLPEGYAIRMMTYTHEALTRWITKRTEIAKDLESRKGIRERFQLARETRRLKGAGLSFVQIAEKLGISQYHANDLMELPTSMIEYARMLRRNGHPIMDICEITGLSKASVCRHTKDVAPEGECTNRLNRFSVITPDENLVFFVPLTGRALGHYVSTVFEGLCDRAGIVRESHILANRVPPPPPGTFILPRGNGHYIFRRTGATIAGMLGEVPESRLQRFLGHKNPEMTRRYLKDPPPDYEGDRMTYDYAVQLTPCKDPIDAIEQFLGFILD
jgi:hypothetical protein